ncbi:MAG: hypothetical protein ABJB03_00360 [Rhodoglobus sp.]
MPTVKLVIPPHEHDVAVEVWVCRLCGAKAHNIDETGSALIGIEHFMDFLGWRTLPDGDVVCELCKRHPDIAHILLANEKAHTQ